jgi:hypothetical protein
MFRNDIRNGATSGNPVLPGPGRDARPELRRPLCRLKIGLYRRWRAGRRPPPTQATLLGRHRPTVGRRPSRRLKSAFPGAMRRASASADASERFSVGAGRPLAERPSRRLKSEFIPGAPRAGRRPPPTQGTFFGRRRPTVGRRPLQVEFIRRSRPTVGRRPHPAEFIRHTGRPSAAGLPRSNSSDAPGRPCSPMGPGRNRRDEADGNGRSV